MAGLFWASATALYWELLVIRWATSEIPVLSYFKNFPLVAAFAGIATGFLLAGSARMVWRSSIWCLAAFSAVVAMSDPLGLATLTFPESNIDVWERGLSTGGRSVVWLSLRNLGLILALLLGCLWGFAGLGQGIGRSFARAGALRAYRVDLLGSLAGLGLMTGLSHLQTPPTVWVALGTGGLWLTAWYAGIPLTATRGPLVALAAVAGWMGWNIIVPSASVVRWSPYYRLEVSRVLSRADGRFLHYKLTANRDIQQVMVDCTDERERVMAGVPERRDWLAWRMKYNLPFQLGMLPANVLIGGAGTGNDVAAALRHGARRVVAVEIDPGVVQFGRDLHPERPYDSDRVDIIQADVRSCLRRSSERFNLITYGIIDSHAALSALSSLRLENYIYTIEGIRDAYRHLTPDGVMCISFYMSNRLFLGHRLYKNIALATGRLPASAFLEQQVHFVFGPALSRESVEAVFRRLRIPLLWFEDAPVDEQVNERRILYSAEDHTYLYKGHPIRPSTDDWPFLYSHPRGQPWVYYAALLGLGAAGIVLALLGAGWATQPSTGVGVADWPMFFLGAGFLLIESKAVTEMALLFGSTWAVNSFVIAGVLLMVLASNEAVAAGWGRSLTVPYILLFLALLGWFAVPKEDLNALSWGLRVVAGVGCVTLPIAFAGVIFSRTLAQRRFPVSAFGSNLAGAVGGAVLEASSLTMGLRALALVALGCYVAAALTMSRSGPAASLPRNGTPDSGASA